MSIAEIILLGPGEGKKISVLGDRYTIKAVGKETNGAYGLVELTTPAKSSGPPPHTHEREDEAFFILEGELSFEIGEKKFQAAAASFAFRHGKTPRHRESVWFKDLMRLNRNCCRLR